MLRGVLRAPPGRTRSRRSVEGFHRFDRVTLEDVLHVCRTSTSLSDAGRRLFAASRRTKSTSNDADRLRKYLAKFGLRWQDVHAAR